MWIKDRNGTLHNTDHLVVVYAMVNPATTQAFVKADNIHEETYILSAHVTIEGANTHLQELLAQLNKEDECRKTSLNSKSD